jgi:DNA processing protein
MSGALFELSAAGGGRSGGPPFDVEDPVLAAAAWSRLAEPGDVVAGALVGHLGAGPALAWLLDAARDPGRALHGAVLDVSLPDATGEAASRRAARQRLAAAVTRWVPRLETLDPRRELHVLDRHGGVLLTPEDARWPAGLHDLGPAAPFALWVRGRGDLGALAARSVAVVGARAATSYGEHVASRIASGLVDRGFTVVSGGAYGIDAAAHRGAIAAGGPTIALLASGVDRFYPQGNHDLLRRVVEDAGAVVSEVPPGSAPYKQRFLARNRLIAAMSRATVVVEAAARSGALSTARRAADLLRPVGAVPGPVTSMASGGCHQLLRDGVATCVTDPAEVAELAGDLGGDAAPVLAGEHRPVDDLDEVGRRLWDALPLRSSASLEAVARAAGLGPREALAGLGGLSLRGLAVRHDGGWRRGG